MERGHFFKMINIIRNMERFNHYSIDIPSIGEGDYIRKLIEEIKIHVQQQLRFPWRDKTTATYVHMSNMRTQLSIKKWVCHLKFHIATGW